MKFSIFANFPFFRIFHFCKFSIFATFHLISLSSSLCRSLSSVPTLAPSALFFVHGELFLLDSLQLVSEVELGSLLLELCKLVLVLGNLFQCRLDEFSSQIIDGNVELVNLKPSFPDFEFHVILLRLALIHAVKVLFADLLQCIFTGALQILWLAAPLVNHLPPLGSLPLALSSA